MASIPSTKSRRGTFRPRAVPPRGPGTLAPAAPPRRPAVPRPLRILKRLLITLAVLAVLGLVGFTWFAYWPLEGRIERVEALVPADVEFLYRTNLAEVRAQGFLQRNVFERPVHPAIDPNKAVVDPATHRTLAQALEAIPEAEAQINDSIPGILKFFENLLFRTTEFRVEKDVFPGEVVAAGKWCAGGDPAAGPPQWRQLLVLTRVSPLVKFAFEAVKHDFVRERSVPRDEVEMTVTPEGWLRVERLNYVEPRRAQTCEGGVVRDSVKVWWVARHLDVLAITNNEDLLHGVVGARGGEERAIDRPGFDGERPDGGLAASIDLSSLHSYLTRCFDGSSKIVSSIVSKFLVVDALDRVQASVASRTDGSPPRDGVAITADVRYSEERLRASPDVLRTYGLAPISVADGIARVVPAKDTAIVVQVKTEPRILLTALFESLSPSDRRLIDGRVRDISVDRKASGKTGYASTQEFLDDLGSQLGSDTGIAISRLSSVFDKVKYEEWFSNADPMPTAVLALVFKIRDGVKQEEVDGFLSDRVRALGFDPPERASSPNGLPYSRLRLPPPKPRDYEFVEPAFAVINGTLVLSTREDFLLEILKTMKGETTSVADSSEFRAAMAPLPRDATVAAFFHAKNLLALAWDFRNDHVHSVGEPELTARLLQLRVDLQKAGSTIDEKALAAINEQVDAEADRYRRLEYARYIDEYRTFLDGCRRIRAAGFVLEARATEQRLTGGASLQFTEAGD